MTYTDLSHAESSAELARTLCRQANILFEQADYAAARTLYERALAIQETLLGPAHPDTARTLHGLAQVQTRQGEDVAARHLLRRALAIQESAFGGEHPDTAATLHTLGELTFNLGEYRAGRDLVARAADIRRHVLGPEHADTLDSMILAALLSAHQGDPGAEQTLSSLLPVCERALGEDHAATARVLNALGRLYSPHEETYAVARTMFERALDIYQRVLGVDHPQTALVLSNLAAVLSDMGDDGAALPLLERSLEIHERMYSTADWRTSFVLLNLADVHRRLGRLAIARRLIERAVFIRERTWGARHEETLRAVRKLVGILENLHREGDEEAMLVAISYHRCVTALERARGQGDAPAAALPGAPVDSDRAAARLHELVDRLAADLARPPRTAEEKVELETVARLSRHADDLYQRGDYGAAAAALEEALHRQERVLGLQHLAHVELLKKLADAAKKQGHYSAVLPIARRIADLYAEVLGPEHPATFAALTNLMSAEEYEFGPSAALPVQERILQSLQSSPSADDQLVTLARATLERLAAETSRRAAGQELPVASLSERREETLRAVSDQEPAPLVGLDDIDWHTLQHAYGPADDVPNLLRLLLSEDSDVRDSAWEELYSNIWHQGDVYEATPHTVPFFVAMLDTPGTPGPQAILWFLHELATGNPWLTEQHTWMEAALAGQGRDFCTEIEEARLYTAWTRQAVSRGADIYIAYLDHPVPEVRRAAARLLLAFPEHAHHVPAPLAAEVEADWDGEDDGDDWPPDAA